MLGRWDVQWKENQITLMNDNTLKKWTYDLTKSPCPNCGKSLIRGTMCWDARRHQNLFNAEKVFSMGSYYSQYRKEDQSDSDILTQHIWELKKDPDFGQPIGKAMALTMINKYTELTKAHFLVPIPSFGTMFNHATALAYGIRNIF